MFWSTKDYPELKGYDRRLRYKAAAYCFGKVRWYGWFILISLFSLAVASSIVLDIVFSMLGIDMGGWKQYFLELSLIIFILIAYQLVLINTYSYHLVNKFIREFENISE